MRRFLTLIATALSVSIAAPALAAPGGHGPQGGNRGPSVNTYDVSVSVDRGERGDRYGRGSDYRPGFEAVHPGKMRQAQRLQARYQADRLVLVSQLRAAERQLQRLESRPRVRPAKIRAARLQVLRIEKKLASLELRYRARLAGVLTPAQIRFFLTLS